MVRRLSGTWPFSTESKHTALECQVIKQEDVHQGYELKEVNESVRAYSHPIITVFRLAAVLKRHLPVALVIAQEDG